MKFWSILRLEVFRVKIILTVNMPEIQKDIFVWKWKIIKFYHPENKKYMYYFLSRW